jgi:hypothetical protein
LFWLHVRGNLYFKDSEKMAASSDHIDAAMLLKK